MKKYKYSKLLKKGIIKRCPICGGNGILRGHGAFGEPEHSKCTRCDGKGMVIDWDNIDKDK